MSAPTPPELPSFTNKSTFFALAQGLFVWLTTTFLTWIDGVSQAMNFNSTNDTSTSSVLIGTGSKSLTVSASKSYLGGMYVVIADTAAPSTNSMTAQVTSYNIGTGAMVVNVLKVVGSGTKTAWTISQCAMPSLEVSTVMQPVTSAASLAAGRTAFGSTTVGDGLFVATTAKAARLILDATKPAFSATKNATQSISSGVLTKTLFQTESYDFDNSYVSSTYTAKVAGLHSFKTRVGFFGLAGLTRAFTSFYVNGVEAVRGDDIASGSSCAAAFDLNLAVDDTVEVWTYIAATTPVIDVYSYFQGALAIDR